MVAPGSGGRRLRGAVPPPHGRETRAVIGLLLATLLIACGTSRPSSPRGDNRLDLLTSYTLALSKRDFRAALGMVAPVERARMTDARGEVRAEYRDRLRAMRLTTLVNHPRIGIEAGHIAGIHDLLPVLEQADTVASAPDPEEMSAPADMGPPPAPARDAEREALRRAASALFASVRARKWDEALKLVDRQEREVFVRSDGKIKEAARSRLMAMDTAAWEALALRDGKLSGIVLLIPTRPSDTRL